MSDDWKQFIADDIAREENLPNYWDIHPDDEPTTQQPEQDQPTTQQPEEK